MTKKSLFILGLTALLMICECVCAQSTPQAGQKTPIQAVPFRLLPGYKMKIGPTFESGPYGTVWKANGPTIQFNLNRYATSEVDSIQKQELLWREEQTVGANHFVCAYTRSDELVIEVIGKFIAHFRAKVQNQKDITEVLLTVFTFEPEHGYPVDPSLIEYEPKRP